MWGHLFHSLTEFDIHQNELMWSRMKVLLTVEGFLLTSAYATKGGYVAPALLIISLSIIYGIWHLFNRDMQYRDGYYKMMQNIIDKSGEIFVFKTGEKFVFKIKSPKGIKGIQIFKYLCILLSSLNIALAFLSIYAIDRKDLFGLLFGK